MHGTNIDVTIVGGGIAGCWLLRLLSEHGYRVALIEQDTLGGRQTLASQGMIHGGLKYALSGNLTGASEAIAEMPETWRACIEGSGPIDLSRVRRLSEAYFMFAEATALGRLTGFFAAKALRGRIDRIRPHDWPESFAEFDGVMYRLNDFVVDTESLLRELVRGLEERTFNETADPEQIRATERGYEIHTETHRWHSRYLISCAGDGSAALNDALKPGAFTMQRRPLKQVSVRAPGLLPIYAHCLTGITGNEPRLTITTHDTEEGPIWYIGGALATTGVERDDDAQMRHALGELRRCLPWVDLSGGALSIQCVDRAEPAQSHGLKPDNAYAERAGEFIQCYPTKLTLAPDLGARVLDLIEPPTAEGMDIEASARPVPMGRAPWFDATWTPICEL